MKHLIILLCAALLLSSLCIDAEDSKVLIVLKHSTGFGNKKYVDKILTPRKPINRTTSLTSLDIFFQPTVVLNAPINYYYTAYKKFTTQYRQSMVNLKIEVCDALKTGSHPVIPVFAKKYDKNESNIFDPCPFKGHRYLKPYYTSYNHFPPIVPIGMWRVDQKITKEFNGKEVDIVQISDYYDVTPTGIEEF